MMGRALSACHGAASWGLRHGRDWAENMVRDLKSIRALWNWLFLALYTWIVVWLVLYHPETSGPTAIMVTGGVVTAIFTNYVWSRHAEKRLQNGHGLPVIPQPGQQMTGDQDNG